MKKLFPFVALLTLQLSASAQVTVSYKPGPSLGDNTAIMTNYGCTLAGYPVPTENMTFGSTIETVYTDWTYNAGGCPHGTTRSLLRFNQVSTIPMGATIMNAQLNLFGVASSGGYYGNTIHPGSPFTLPNDGLVNEVTSPWTLGVVTWATQPSYGSSVSLPVTTMRWNENMSANVTSMVQNMVSSGNNYGFMTSLQTEAYYKAVVFGGNANSDSTLWPELVITYCDPTFTYCINTNTPYTVDLTANTIAPGEDYEWYVNGVLVGTGPSISYYFGAPGSYDVCLQIINKDDHKEMCKSCIKLCIDDNGRAVPPTDGLHSKMAPSKAIKGTLPVSEMPDVKTGHISPNPTHTGWNIAVDNAKKEGNKTDIIIYDLSGKVLQKQTKVLNAGKNVIYQNAANLAPGTYLIEVTDGKTSWKEKANKE